MSFNLASTRVDFLLANNVTWDDQLQFGYPDDQTWSFAGASFLLAVNTNPGIPSPPGPTPLVTFSSVGGTIVVADPVLRILGMNVPDTSIQQYLPVGCYVYDLIMVSGTGSRDALCWGQIQVVSGVTP